MGQVFFLLLQQLPIRNIQWVTKLDQIVMAIRHIKVKLFFVASSSFMMLFLGFRNIKKHFFKE